MMRRQIFVTSRAVTDRGALSIFVAITTVSLLMLVGLVIDGGGRLRAVERADAVAQEAARAGGEQIDQVAALRGQGIKLDVAAAKSAIETYLRQNQLDNQPDIQVTTTTVTVKVNAQYQTMLLGVIGLGTLSVHGQGRAVLVQGVNKAE